jgi:hypothetical protein
VKVASQRLIIEIQNSPGISDFNDGAEYWRKMVDCCAVAQSREWRLIAPPAADFHREYRCGGLLEINW